MKRARDRLFLLLSLKTRLTELQTSLQWHNHCYQDLFILNCTRSSADARESYRLILREVRSPAHTFVIRDTGAHQASHQVPKQGTRQIAQGRSPSTHYWRIISQDYRCVVRRVFSTKSSVAAQGSPESRSSQTASNDRGKGVRAAFLTQPPLYFSSQPSCSIVEFLCRLLLFNELAGFNSKCYDRHKSLQSQCWRKPQMLSPKKFANGSQVSRHVRTSIRFQTF